MQLHHLSSSHRIYPKTRIGRGGKRGTTSGRGTKGQGSRSGHRIRPAERDILQRLPKLRGSRYRLAPRMQTVALTLGVISRSLSGSSVTLEALRVAGLVRRTDDRVKVLAGGSLDRSMTFEGVSVSEGARKAILAAGGSVKDAAPRTTSVASSKQKPSTKA